MSYRDHYKLLGINKQSNQLQIKAAFRKLSMIHHPDRNGNTERSNRNFRIILNAYEILSDEVKKEAYDEFLKKSNFIRKFGYSDKLHLSGKTSLGNKEVLNLINITLWEIEDIIMTDELNSNIRRYLLIILTFLDKWILEPSGYPDYYMEARRLEKIDPREYVRILAEGKAYSAHLPYVSLSEYYFDIRKRADKFMTEYENKIGWGDESDSDLNLIDIILEYHNMALYYLSWLLCGTEEEQEVTIYKFSDAIFNYNY